MRFARTITAQDGCIIYFPYRSKSEKRPRVISGLLRTRKGWGEEWVQIRDDAIEIEIRLEKDKVVDLGNELQCSAVAKLWARIDKQDLENSMAKLAEFFQCSPTSNRDTVVETRHFKEKLTPEIRGVVHQVVSRADYRKLLGLSTYIEELKQQSEDESEGSPHIGELKQQFEEKIKDLLKECGFTIIICDLQITPLDPGTTVMEHDIRDRWFELELESLRKGAEHEGEKDRIKEELEEKRERQKLEQKAETEEHRMELKVREDRAKGEYEADLRGIEIKKTEENNLKERKLSELRQALDDFFNELQEKKDTYEYERNVEQIENEEKLAARKHQQEVKQLENQRELNKLKMEETRLREEMKLEHQKTLRDQEREALNEEKQVRELTLEVAKINAEVERIKGLAGAEVMEAEKKAENIVEKESQESHIDLLKQLFSSMPEIVKSMPIEKVGDTTLIHLGKDIDFDSTKAGYGVLGLAFLPIVKEIISKLPEKLNLPVFTQEASPAKVTYEINEEKESESGGSSEDDYSSEG